MNLKENNKKKHLTRGKYQKQNLNGIEIFN